MAITDSYTGIHRRPGRHVGILFIETFLSSFLSKLLQLLAFTTFHSIHMQKFAKKTFVVVKSSARNVKLFGKQYMVYVCSRLGG